MNTRCIPQHAVAAEDEPSHTLCTHDTVMAHVKRVLFNRNIPMHRRIRGELGRASLDLRVNIHRRLILPLRLPCRTDIKGVAANRQITNRAGFIPLVGIVREENRRHRHILKHIVFNQHLAPLRAEDAARGDGGKEVIADDDFRRICHILRNIFWLRADLRCDFLWQIAVEGNGHRFEIIPTCSGID